MTDYIELNNTNNNEEKINDTDILYNDKYIQITNNEIMLKKYYFPSFSSKKIEFSDIEYICSDQEYGVDILGYKVWGMGLSTIYWAYGKGRGLSRPKYNYILKKHNTTLCSGFSVENPTEFCKIIETKGIKNKKSE
jgi:hypothetical protein